MDLVILTPRTKATSNIELKIWTLDIKGDRSVTGTMKWSSYRYQTFSKSRRRGTILVFTQDTLISYRQISYNTGVAINIPGEEEETIGAGQGALYNHVTYKSASAYWLYRPGMDEDSNIKLKKGSGVSFGTAIQFKVLFNIAKDPGNPDQRKNLITYAKALRLTTEQMEEFIKSVFSEEDLKLAPEDAFPDLMDTYNHVLIESNFIFTKAYTTSLLRSDSSEKNERISISDLTQDIKLKKIFSDEPVPKDFESVGLQAESIHIRVRIADHKDNPDKENIFTLGFKILETGTKFTLDKIKDSGNEGVFHYHSFFFNNDGAPDNLDDPHQYFERTEKTVPSVFLAHHTL